MPTLQLDSDVAKQMCKGSRAGEKGMPISDEPMEKINMLLQDKDRAVVAVKTGISYSTVVRYDNTKKKSKLDLIWKEIRVNR